MHSVPKQLGKGNTTKQPSRRREKFDESSGDELGDNASLHNVPKVSIRLPSLHSYGAIPTDEIVHPESKESSGPKVEAIKKPLPLVPPKDPFATQKKHWQNRPALTEKTTNMKASSAKANRRGRPKISPPILKETTNAAIHASDLHRPNIQHTSQSDPTSKSCTTDAAALSQKISSLMAEAAAQEEQTQSKSDGYSIASARLSALERGKNVFVRATRTIKERLSNGSNENVSISKRPLAVRHSSYQEFGSSKPLVKYEIDQEISRGRLARRIAEGENLSNPKIMSLTGDGNIARKPLPVYESMRSRSQRSASAEDPFSDNKEAESPIPYENYSGFEFDFTKHKDTHSDKPERCPESPSQSQDQMDKPSKLPDEYPSDGASQSRFSNMISGLAQHPDTMFFSSPPTEHSTPRIRLEPQIDASRHIQKQSLLPHSPSVMDISFEDQGDVTAGPPGSPRYHEAKASDGSSFSVKRKSGSEDLRGQQTPLVKKSKTDSTGSDEDHGLSISLTDGIRGLDTGNERTPLSPKDPNRRQAKVDRKAKIRKGVSIFDVGKGKAPERREDDDVPSGPQARPDMFKRSSFSLPSSILFSRSREARNDTHQYMQMDSNSMDIDELQLDDVEYQVGKKTV